MKKQVYPRFIMVLVAWVAWVAWVAIGTASAGPVQNFQPGRRTLLDAHNCYPYLGQWADRVDRALATGMPVGIENDLIWDVTKPGAPRVVVSHGGKAKGDEPTLRDYFFEKVRPLVERALRDGDRRQWPLITLNINDLRSEDPAFFTTLWSLMGEYESWLCTAPKTDDPKQVAPLDVKPVLVLTSDGTQQAKVFYDSVPVGGRLRMFAAGKPSQKAGNFRRWINYAWKEVEPEGQPKAGDWTAADAARLQALVEDAHAKGYWIRFYTLNGHGPLEVALRGWTPSYNFGSLAAVTMRWQAAQAAGVDFLATDQYEECAKVLAASKSRASGEDSSRREFVRVSPRDERYLEFTSGKPYIPIGLNMIAPPGERWETMEEWMRQLSENGGNYLRIWLGNPYFDIEPRRSGEYDADKAKRLDQMLETAQQRGIRIKICLESFRHFSAQGQRWSAKPLHLVSQGGTASDIADFFNGEPSRQQFKRKLAWLAQRYGSQPAVFGWELWNEINAVAGGDYLAWTEVMLAELHRLFPSNLCLQSLGSFDTERVDKTYRRHSLMPGNDLAQVHRYLDLGAEWEVCHGPVDVLAAEAVRRALSYQPHRPVLLAESGAVEPKHSGPFKLYEKDKEGALLHDVLFAPFFAGAAGPGHIWHWDVYVARNGLWPQFARFAEAVKEIDPPAEGFEPLFWNQDRLRVYALKGKQTVLIWCRDSQNDWRSELAEGKVPELLTGLAVPVTPLGLKAGIKSARIYDPWANAWSEAKVEKETIPLPAFRRSIVIRLAIESGKL